MRCDCCQKPLSDYESTLRHAITLEFMDTCRKCLTGLNIPTIGREDLDMYEVMEDDEYDIQDNQENEDV